MKNISVAQRYALAMMTCAQSEKAVDPIHNAFSDFVTLLQDSQDLRNVLQIPTFSSKDRDKVLSLIFAKTMYPASFKEFLKIVSNKNRFDYIELIFSEFLKLVYEQQNISQAQVESAVELNSTQKKAVVSWLDGKFKAKFQVSYQLNKKLLGGLRISVGSFVYDNSTAQHINVLEERIA